MITHRSKRNPLPIVGDASDTFGVLEVGAHIASGSDKGWVGSDGIPDDIAESTFSIAGVQVAEDLANLWTNDYLIERMGERPISVAVTPNGYNTKPTFQD